MSAGSAGWAAQRFKIMPSGNFRSLTGEFKLINIYLATVCPLDIPDVLNSGFKIIEFAFIASGIIAVKIHPIVLNVDFCISIYLASIGSVNEAWRVLVGSACWTAITWERTC